MNIGIKYGSKPIELVFYNVPFLIKAKDLIRNMDENKFKNDLENYTIPKNYSKKITSIAIVVSDKTRLAEFQQYLPCIEESLNHLFNNNFYLQFYIAYGTHPRQSDKESQISYGDIYSKYDFIHHDSEKETFQHFGTTSFGTEVLINRKLFENDLIITYGAISHHYFAGFGGGRKLIFPGLAAKKSILHNHSLFLDFTNKSLNPNCQPGILKGNPVAEDLKEIYQLLPKSIGIHAILNNYGKVCQFHIGDNYGAFENACKSHSEHYKIKSDKSYDLVIASAGGYPKDINFIQAHKSIHNASSFVKDGGKLIVFANCIDGIGNNQFLKLFKLGGWSAIFSKMEGQFENNAGTALALMQKTKRIQIFMVTALSKEVCNLLGVKKINEKDAQKMIDRFDGELAVIENASIIF